MPSETHYFDMDTTPPTERTPEQYESGDYDNFAVAEGSGTRWTVRADQYYHARGELSMTVTRPLDEVMTLFAALLSADDKLGAT